MGKSGISNDTTILLYGDNNNWFASYAFWQLKYYGHKNIRLINGGRKKWIEEKRPLTTEATKVNPATYHATGPDESIRARKEEVFAILEKRKTAHLVDVRSADEFSGRIVAPPGMTETAQRGGHIPGAASVPWSQAANEDGTFKSAEALEQLYGAKGLSGLRRSDHLLPHRGAQFAYLVRADVPAGLRSREELRWLVDRVGKPGGRADREGKRLGVRGALKRPESLNRRSNRSLRAAYAGASQGVCPWISCKWGKRCCAKKRAP